MFYNAFEYDLAELGVKFCREYLINQKYKYS